MLDEAGLDDVIVETGADIHAAFCAKGLEKNVNVLTDIPVVANLKEAEMLWKAAQESKAQIYVGANPNYAKYSTMLKSFYDKGLLGKPYCMEAEYIHWSLPGSGEDIHLNENGDWRYLLNPIRYCTHSLGPLLAILDEELRKVSAFGTGERTPPEYANNPKAVGHGGIDYAMLDHFFMAIGEGKGNPVSLKAGLAMTLPGIYAEESAKRGGQVLTMRYPWDEDWTTEIN